LDAPLVSVIVAAFNAEQWIGEALDSILAQTYGKLEVVVVDDGSTDGTAAVVRSFGPRIRYVHQRNSGGAAAPRNLGIAHSSGEVLCFLDADDVYVRNRVESHVGFWGRHPQVGLVFSDYRNFDAQGPSPVSHFQVCPELMGQIAGQQELVLVGPCRVLAQENFGITGSVSIRRSLLRHQPGFDTRLRACEDFHFYYTLARHTQVGIVNEIGMLRRLHERNMTKEQDRMLLHGIRSYALLRDGENDPLAKAALAHYIADCHVSLARRHAERGEYLQAFREQWRALFADAGARRLWNTGWGMARTIAIATGLHRPRQSGA
jgi:glycosyltransferase involved in cell wall biosynthesis